MRQLVGILCSVLLMALPTYAATPRQIIDFNPGWKFYLGDVPQAALKNYDDTRWRRLNLPHDWSIEQDYTTEGTAGSTGFLPAGIGWYRKSFEVPKSWKGDITHIEFDGVYKNAEVWINGHYLGIRPYGYSAFGYELTPHLNYGGNNTVTVKVDHSDVADSRWYTGSGIYRNVRLVKTNEIYIPQFGAWVTTPEVSAEKAKIDISAIVKNADNRKEKVRVKALIKDAGGTVIARESKPISVTVENQVEISLNLNNPKLWSIEETNQYKAEIQIWRESKLEDSYVVDFGIRSIRFDANTGFYLNDKNVKLKGVCLHHDAGAVGAVFIRDVWKRRLDRLKEIGVNAIRSSHNPMDPGLLKLTDEMGFVVINEALDEWRRNKNKWITSRFAQDMRSEMESGYGDIYEEWAERDVKNMVHYSRNHPSIIMWSMGNEIEWTYPYYWKMQKSNQRLGNTVLKEETGDGRDELKETAVEIMGWIKEVDDTRPVTTGGVLPKAGNITGYFDVPDVMGYNYRAKDYDSDHKNYPNRVIYGSENWGTYQEWKDTVDRDFVAGIFIWTGIAYMGESGPFPWKGLEISLLDFAGFYTPRGHFFKTLWSDEPYVYLATKNAKKAEWIQKDGKWVDNRVRHWLDKWLFQDVEETWNYADGDEVFVEVYANTPEVELFVNGKSYGVKRPDDFEDHIVKYLVPYDAGEIKAVGLANGQSKADFQIKTAKWIGKVVLKADRTSMKANGKDVVHIEAFLQSKAGAIVPDKKVQLEFTVEGEGRNIGVDNGWERNVQKHKSDLIVTHNGKALMLVQASEKPGLIKVKARSGQLLSNEIIVRTTE